MLDLSPARADHLGEEDHTVPIRSVADELVLRRTPLHAIGEDRAENCGFDTAGGSGRRGYRDGRGAGIVGRTCVDRVRDFDGGELTLFVPAFRDAVRDIRKVGRPAFPLELETAGTVGLLGFQHHATSGQAGLLFVQGYARILPAGRPGIM